MQWLLIVVTFSYESSPGLLTERFATEAECQEIARQIETLGEGGFFEYSFDAYRWKCVPVRPLEDNDE